MSKYFVGIDIGSTSAKTVVLDENKNIIERILLPTGWSSKETSEIILKKLNDLGEIVITKGLGTFVGDELI